MAVSILVVLASILLVKVDDVRDRAEITGTRATMETVREAFMGSAAGPGCMADLKYLPGFDLTTLKVKDLLDGSPYQAYDPMAQRGWRGPYVTNVQSVRNATNPAATGLFPAATDIGFNGDWTFQRRNFYDPNTGAAIYGMAGDRAIADAWGNPIVLLIPADVYGDTSVAKRLLFARLVSAGPNGILDASPTDPCAGLGSDGKGTARKDDIVIFLNRPDIYEGP